MSTKRRWPTREWQPVLFFDDADRILLVEPLHKDYRDIPGGYVEKGESLLEVCMREVHAEHQAHHWSPAPCGLGTESRRGRQGPLPSRRGPHDVRRAHLPRTFPQAGRRCMAGTANRYRERHSAPADVATCVRETR
ncbi:NUDIX domain-containing protein [Streptomyces inhibens]|uniref:NUDIX domain-containing protein n=1 Tax=Streptomyces inhibens TaxID=2293571 RepID=UPI0036C6E941